MRFKINITDGLVRGAASQTFGLTDGIYEVVTLDEVKALELECSKWALELCVELGIPHTRERSRILDAIEGIRATIAILEAEICQLREKP